MAAPSTGSRRISARRARAYPSGVRDPGTDNGVIPAESFHRNSKRHTRGDFDQSGLEIRRRLAASAGACYQRHGPRPDDGFGPAVLDAQDAVDTPARAHGGGFGAVAGVFHGEADSVALGSGPILEVESNAAQARRAGLHCHVGKLARPSDLVHTNLQRIPGHVTAGHAPAIHVVELLVEPRADRFQRVTGNRRGGQGFLHGGHRVRILPLRVTRASCARFDRQRQVGNVRGAPHDGLARRHDRRSARTLLRGRGSSRSQHGRNGETGKRASDSRLVSRSHGHTH